MQFLVNWEFIREKSHAQRCSSGVLCNGASIRRDAFRLPLQIFV